MRAFGALDALVRRTRSELAVLLVTGIVLAVAVAVAASIPRRVAQVTDTGLRRALGDTAVSERGVELAQSGILPPDDGSPFRAVAERGEQLQSDLPAPLERLVGQRTWVVETPQYQVSSPAIPANPRFVTLRQMEGLGEHTTLAAGRAPRPTDRTVEVDPDLFGGSSVYIDGRLEQREITEAMVVEVAVSPRTAEQLRVELGDTLVLAPDAEDPLARRFALYLRVPLAIQVVGLVQPADLDEPYWFGDDSLHRAVQVRDDSDILYTYATAMFAPEAYGQLIEAIDPIPLRYSWRHQVDVTRISGADLADVQAALRTAEARYVSTRFVPLEQTGIRTGLDTVLGTFARSRTAAIVLLAMVALGTAALAVIAIALLAHLRSLERGDTVRLLHARGGSRSQLVAGEVGASLLLVLPAAVLGATIAHVAVPSRDVPGDLVAAVALALLALVLLVATSLAQDRLVPLDRDARRRRILRRRASGVVMVLAALVGVYLVRRRGLGPALADATGEATVDLFLVAVPILVAGAAGILLASVLPLLLAMAAATARRGRAAVAHLGLTRVARMPAATTAAPVVVVVLGLGFAAFAGSIVDSVGQAQQRAAWHEVGADHRIDTTGTSALPDDLPLDGIDGVAAVAAAHVDDTVPVSQPPVDASNTGGYVGQAHLVAVDPAAYADVIEPGPLSLPPGALRGGGAPVPAVVTTAWLGGQAASVGDVYDIRLRGESMQVEIAAVVPRIPTFAPDVSAMLVARDAAAAAIGDLGSNRLYVDGGDVRAALERALADVTGGVRITSLDLVLERIRTVPMVAATLTTLQATAAVAAAMAAIALVTGLVLAARARRRDIGHLRTLGLGRRQVAWIVAVEILPSTAVALAAGVALGALLRWLVGPALALDAFMGLNVPDVLGGAPATTVALVVVLAAVTMGGLAVAFQRARAIDLADHMRTETR